MLLVAVIVAGCGSAPQADPVGFADAVDRGEQVTREIAEIIADGLQVEAEPVSYGFRCDSPGLGREGAGITLEISPEFVDDGSVDQVVAYLLAEGFEVVVPEVDGELEAQNIHGAEGESTVDVLLGSESVRIDFVTACYRTE
ncbi:MAG: hypothetical protein KJ698_13330 [Actinobacteria bacterium]|nr:hypothetical protein [Actinomycetota bacterium]MBU1494872.1 hypothetical protein [Actinomycetota bacterium]